MNKLIIENRTNLIMKDIMPYIQIVLSKGRISNYGKQYCYLTAWKRTNIVVYSDLNKKSDRLIVNYLQK